MPEGRAGKAISRGHDKTVPTPRLVVAALKSQSLYHPVGPMRRSVLNSVEVGLHGVKAIFVRLLKSSNNWEKTMISIEIWAYIRRLYFHDGLGILAIAKELTLDRKTVRSAIQTDDFLAKKQKKHSRPSKLDSFKEEIDRILERTPRLSGVHSGEIQKKRL